jgi:hypothetical protein
MIQLPGLTPDQADYIQCLTAQGALTYQKVWAPPKFSALTLKPCPEETEDLCCYPDCNCAMQRLPAD